MTKRSAIQVLLDKLYAQIRAYQQPYKAVAQSQPDQPGAENPLPPYSELPLAIGNELLITSDLAKVYQELTNFIGRVVIIDQILTKEGLAIKASAFGIQVGIDRNAAQQMRWAFLQREQAFIS